MCFQVLFEHPFLFEETIRFTLHSSLDIGCISWFWNGTEWEVAGELVWLVLEVEYEVVLLKKKTGEYG